MKNLYLLFVIFLFIWGNSFGQVRPNSTISMATGPQTGNHCLFCNVQNPDLAWDNSESSYCNLNIDSSLIGGFASVTYEFPNNLDHQSFITINMSIGGLPILSGVISDLIFQRVSLEFLDAQNNPVMVYDSTNRTAVELVSAATNEFNLRIFNQSPDTRRVRIIAHSLGFPLAQDIRIHDISYVQSNFVFAQRPINAGSGYSGGLLSLCVNCGITDIQNPIEMYDENSEAARMWFPISANVLASNYLYADYDWNNTTSDGALNDLYILMEMDGVSSAPLQIFNTEELQIRVNYSDNTSEIFNASSGGITAEKLYAGSDRFSLQIDLNDAKDILSVQVRLYQPTLSLLHDLKIYTIFVGPTSPNVLPVEIVSFDAEILKSGVVALDWTSETESNSDYYMVEHSTNGLNWIDILHLKAAGNSAIPSSYKGFHTSPDLGSNHYRLTPVDLDGSYQAVYLTSVVKHDARLISVYPSPCQSSTNLDFELEEPAKVSYSIADIQGKVLHKVEDIALNAGHHSLPVAVSDLPNGMYLLSARTGTRRFIQRIQVLR